SWACDHHESSFLRCPDSEEALVSNHEGTQVEALVCARRHPGSVDLYQLFERADKELLGQLGERQTTCALVHTPRVRLRPEGHDVTIRVPVRFDSFKDFLAVVQNRRRGVHW